MMRIIATSMTDPRIPATLHLLKIAEIAETTPVERWEGRDGFIDTLLLSFASWARQNKNGRHRFRMTYVPVRTTIEEGSQHRSRAELGAKLSVMTYSTYMY